MTSIWSTCYIVWLFILAIFWESHNFTCQSLLLSTSVPNEYVGMNVLLILKCMLVQNYHAHTYLVHTHMSFTRISMSLIFSFIHTHAPTHVKCKTSCVMQLQLDLCRINGSIHLNILIEHSCNKFS